MGSAVQTLVVPLLLRFARVYRDPFFCEVARGRATSSTKTCLSLLFCFCTSFDTRSGCINSPAWMRSSWPSSTQRYAGPITFLPIAFSPVVVSLEALLPGEAAVYPGWRGTGWVYQWTGLMIPAGCKRTSRLGGSKATQGQGKGCTFPGVLQGSSKPASLKKVGFGHTEWWREKGVC